MTFSLWFASYPCCNHINFSLFLCSAMIVAPDVWLSSLTKKQPEDQKDNTNLTIYACLVSGSLIFAIIRAYGFLLVSLRCSERLHDKMVLAILQAPVHFFDSNPVGRILNRFSKDVGCLDELLPKTFLGFIQRVPLAFAAIIISTVANPWLLFLVIPLIVLVLYMSKYYLKTSREVKRLESLCRSPVFSHFSETLNGLDTIRTRGRKRDILDQFYRWFGLVLRVFRTRFTRGLNIKRICFCIRALLRKLIGFYMLCYQDQLRLACQCFLEPQVLSND